MNNIQKFFYLLCSMISIAAAAEHPDIAATLQQNNVTEPSCQHIVNALRSTPERIDAEEFLEIGSALAVHALTSPNHALRNLVVASVIENVIKKHGLHKSFYNAQVPIPSLLWYRFPFKWTIEVGTKQLASTLYLMALEEKDKITLTNILATYFVRWHEVDLDYSSTVTTWPMPIYKSQVAVMISTLIETIAEPTLQQQSLVKFTSGIFNYGIVSSILHTTAKRTGLPQKKLDILFSRKCYAQTPLQKCMDHAIKCGFDQVVDRFYPPQNPLEISLRT